MKNCMWKDQILDHAYSLFEEMEEVNHKVIAAVCFFVYRYNFDVEKLQSPLYERVIHAMKYAKFSDIPETESQEVDQLLYHCQVLFENVQSDWNWVLDACFFFVLLFDFDKRKLPSYLEEEVENLMKKHYWESNVEEYAC